MEQNLGDLPAFGISKLDINYGVATQHVIKRDAIEWPAEGFKIEFELIGHDEI